MQTGPALIHVDTVDDALLAEVVRRVLEVANPEKVVLFGSHAHGTPNPGSDLDLLILWRTELPPFRRAAVFYRALAGLLLPKDILVYTPEEAQAWSGVPEALVTSALRRGRVLYARSS